MSKGILGHCMQAAVLPALIMAMTSSALAQQPAGELTPAQREGKRLFVQRCSVCHLPSPSDFYDPALPTYGPKLEGVVRDTESGKRARVAIREGTARMPGFRYTLTGGEIDQLLAYLKVFQLSEFVRPGAEVGGGPDVVAPVGEVSDTPMEPVLD